jgi:hypothetical protein
MSIRSMNTLYPALGDAVGYVMQIALLGLLVIPWLARRKERNGKLEELVHS